jgi:predicted dehydrogenase
MSEPIGVALLGTAHTTHAWSYARALSQSPAARLVGVFDDDPALTQWIERDFAVPVYADARELVGSPDVQAVVVCGTTVGHRGSVELAASLGRHVLCEKPIATTLDDARAITQACDSAGVLLQVAFVSRFLPMVQTARELVGAGRLGDLIGMVGGNRGRPPLAPAYPGWITDSSQAGGGALIDHSVHVVDVMRHITGLEVVAVSAECGSLLWDCGVDDAAIMSLSFDNGAVASVDPSWSVPEGNPWDYDFYLRLLCTEGSLDITDLAEAVNVVSSSSDSPAGLRLHAFGEDADAAMIEAFVASIQTGNRLEPCASGIDGLKALEVALAGYASAAEGAVVRMR